MIALRAPVGKIKSPDVRTFGNKGQDLLCNISHWCTRAELARQPYVNAGVQRVVYHKFTAFFLTHQRVIGTTSVPATSFDAKQRDHWFNIRKNM